MSRITSKSGLRGDEGGIAPWQEWRERCALGLCASETQRILRGFAEEHFVRIARRHAHMTAARDLKPRLSEGDAWHLLETHMTVRANREGKRYKEWLFSRAAEGEDVAAALHGGAVVLIRDAVREYLRREHSPSGTVSMNAPVAGVEEGMLTLEDLLPGDIDPADEVATRELQRLAESRADEFLGSLDKRSRLVMLARAIGVPLSDPAVESIAGCRKSVLHDAFRDACERLVLSLRDEYKREDPAAVRMLALMTLEAASESLRARPTVDKASTSLLRMAGKA